VWYCPFLLFSLLSSIFSCNATTERRLSPVIQSLILPEYTCYFSIYYSMSSFQGEVDKKPLYFWKIFKFSCTDLTLFFSTNRFLFIFFQKIYYFPSFFSLSFMNNLLSTRWCSGILFIQFHLSVRRSNKLEMFLFSFLSCALSFFVSHKWDFHFFSWGQGITQLLRVFRCSFQFKFNFEFPADFSR
jgi:hypothetical protein